MKEWFRARNIWGSAIMEMTDEEAGRLFKAVFAYTRGGEIVQLTGSGQIMLTMILDWLKKDADRDAEISMKRAKAVEKYRKQKALKEQQNDHETSNEQQGDHPASNDQQSDHMTSIDENQNQNQNQSQNQNQNQSQNQNQNQNQSQNQNQNQNRNKNINNKNNKEKEKERESLFNRFWAAYPRKVAKTTARQSFDKVDPDEPLLEAMITAIERWEQTEQWKDNEGRFIPHPATWLNQRRWEDEVPAAGKRKPTVTAQQYEQRDYSLVQAEIEAELEREMEEYMRAERMKQESAINNSEQGIKTESECENI